MYSSKIKVQYKSGSIAKGIKVCLSISGISSGGITETKYTDSYGIAIINHSSKGEAKVIVNGSTKSSIRVPGETTIFI